MFNEIRKMVGWDGWKAWQRLASSLKHTPRPRKPYRSRACLRVEALEQREMLTAGAFDPTFSIGGQAAPDFSNIFGREAQANAVAIQSDGKIVIAGFFTTASGNEDIGVVRLNPDGTYDSSFGNGGRSYFNYQGLPGFGPNAEANAVAIDQKGRIVIAGDARTTTGQEEMIVARLNSVSGPSGVAGGFDSTFTNGGRSYFDYKDLPGFAPNAQANAVAIDQQDRIVVAGFEYTTDGGTNMTITRLNSESGPSGVAGGFDSTFTNGGRSYTNYLGIPGFRGPAVANAVAIDQQGRIVVAGTAQTSVGEDMAIIRLNSVSGPSGVAGGFDSTFTNGGRSYTNYYGLPGFGTSALANAVAIDQQDRIVVAGTADLTNGGSDMAIIRLNSVSGPSGVAGGFDSTFTNSGRSYTSFSWLDGNTRDVADGVTIDPQGNIVVVGFSSNVSGGNTYMAVARLLSTGPSAGGFDTSFGRGGATTFPINGENISGNEAVAVDPQGRIVVASTGVLGGTPNFFAVARLNDPLPPPGGTSVNLGTVGNTTAYFAMDALSRLCELSNGGWQPMVSTVTNQPVQVQSFSLANVGGVNSLVALSSDGTLYIGTGLGLNISPSANAGSVKKFQIGTLNGIAYLFALETNGQLECLLNNGWKVEASNVQDFTFATSGSTNYVSITESTGVLNLTQP